MTLQIPDGYGLFSMHFKCTLSTHECIVSHGYQNNSAASAVVNLPILRAAWTASSARPFETSQMSNKWSLVQCHVAQNTAGSIYVADDFTVINGNQSTEFPPMNTALLCKKVTGIAGRKFRGRMFVPPLNITELGMNEAGIWDATALAAVQVKFSAAEAALISGSVPPVLLHDSSMIPTPCHFVLSNKAGTIRTRIR